MKIKKHRSIYKYIDINQGLPLEMEDILRNYFCNICLGEDDSLVLQRWDTERERKKDFCQNWNGPNIDGVVLSSDENLKPWPTGQRCCVRHRRRERNNNWELNPQHKRRIIIKDYADVVGEKEIIVCGESY